MQQDLRRTVRVVIPSTVEPVTRDYCKLFIRESDTDQDLVIDLLIPAVRKYAENLTRRSFMPQTLELWLDSFPCNPWGVIELPRPPFQSVVSFTYIDGYGNTQQVAPTDYQIDPMSEPARIKPVFGNYWKITRNDFGAVRIRYLAGYVVDKVSSPTQDVPEGIRQWIAARVAQLYEQRESIIVGMMVQEIPHHFIDGLLDPYVVDMFV